MQPDCARCRTFVCRKGRPDLAPPECPMQEPFPPFEELYDQERTRRLVTEAARIEAEGYGRWPRVHETVVLAHRMGWRRVGIAFAPDTRREASLTARWFRDAGLQPVLPDAAAGLDAASQAASLAGEGTGLNVIVGLPVAAEAVFIRMSHAPVTSLVARDAALQHNPAAALYTSAGYYRKKLRIQQPPTGERTPRTDLLALQAAEMAWEERGEARCCRITEAMRWVASLGLRRLGISFCVGFRGEARTLVSILERNGFETLSLCCKSGAVPKEELGLADREKVHPGGPEMICNSVAQGRLLGGTGADAVFILGQCAGHDAATLGELEVPAVVLVAKDRVYAHNTAAPLYASEES